MNCFQSFRKIGLNQNNSWRKHKGIMASNTEDNTNHARRRRHIRSINMKVSRPVYTEHEFQQGYEQNDLDQSASMRVRKFVGQQRCTLSSVKSFMTGRFPIFKWLPAYEVRQNLLSDIISGLTVGTMRIPQGIRFRPVCFFFFNGKGTK